MEPQAVSVSTHHSGNRTRAGHDRWILAIGMFKLLQALLFLLMGIGAVRLLHKDLVGIAEHFIYAMRFNPEGRLVNFILVKVAMIDPHRLRQISAAIFGIAALDLVEGTGLVMQKAWAEYVTLVLTASFLPFELYELSLRLTWIRCALTVINIAVVLYLLWFVKRRMPERRERNPGGA